jgi:hypothetical protein
MNVNKDLGIESIKIGAKIWQNSSENLFASFEGMWNGHISCIFYEHIIMAGAEI